MDDVEENPTGLNKWHWIPVLVISIPGVFYGIVGRNPDYLIQIAAQSSIVLFLTAVTVISYRKLSLSKWDLMSWRGWRVIILISTIMGVMTGFFYPGMSGAAGYFGSVLWFTILGYPIAVLLSAGKFGFAKITG